MKIVYSWLKEIVDIDIPAHELADALAGAGLEVSSLSAVRVPAGIKVAKVLETGKHPNADRLTVCKVDTGTDRPLAIVCGAPNVKPGMISALAVEGAVLGPGLVVKKTKLRGVESYGMLCSERELGLSDDHGGIINLPPECKIGEELSVYFPEDAVIEIEITPSRGDCLSVIGVAREVAARYGLPLKETAIRPAERHDDPLSAAIAVEIRAPDSCPRYAGRLIRGISIGPSPEWMQRRLTLAGLRPINNVVDITNYLMLHYGQPMHAFDYDRIKDRKIIVRKADDSLVFTTLDGTRRDLAPDDLLICDGERPVALAGVMGGAGSGISDATVNVFLECAFFSPRGIRKTSKRLGLSTDASYRFERGVDPEGGLIDALDTAASLIAKFGGGTVASGAIDNYPQPVKQRTVTIRAGRASRVLGYEFSREKIIGFLSSLGLRCTPEGNDAVVCDIPSFRHDLSIEEDLIEEVGRLYGYDAIPPAEYARVHFQHQLPLTEYAFDTLRNALAYFGFNELVTNSMSSEKKRLLLTPEKQPVVLLNPLNPDMAHMRTTLASTMLEVLSYNHNRKNYNNKFFEIGKTYELLSSGERQETDVLAMLLDGNWIEPSWNTPPLPCDFYLAKGVLDALASHIGAGRMAMTPLSASHSLFDAAAVHVAIGDSIAGIAGELAERIRDAFDIKSRVYYIELNISAYLNAPTIRTVFAPLPKFPALERDFSFVLPEHLSATAISGEIYGISPLIENVRPFDVYRGEKLGKGLKSITFSVTIRSAEKTLTDQEAEGIGATIAAKMKEKFNVMLRT